MVLFDAMAEEYPGDDADRETFPGSLRAWMAGDGAGHAVWIAWDESRPVGMIWLATVPRVPRPHLLERRSGDIQTFWIRPEMRGRGLGKRMLDAVLAEADSLVYERLVVHSSEVAITIYERAGFRSERIMLTRTRP